MGFSNSIFLFLFFPLSMAFYYLFLFLQKKIKFLKRLRITDLIIIFISSAFYGWALAIDVLKLFVFSFVVYFLGRIIRKTNGKSKKNWLVGTLLVLVLILFVYKYIGFFTKSSISLVAPIGLSFIIFGAISYVVDIYREKASANNFIDAMLYFTFFPKIISGPIVLWKDFQKQIREREYSSQNILDGINLIIIGLAKKIIIADFFGSKIVLINKWIGKGIDIPTAIGLIIIYSLQLYYDFSGYSDIAIGLSKLFGFNFSKNFNYPYMANSITDFWRRWHISLGTWFKEYVYIPLGGNRKGKRRTLCNLLIVFILTGIWHGSGWCYIIWGLMHGTLRIIEKILEKNQKYLSIPNIFKRIFTIIFVFIGWEFFLFDGLRNVISFNKILFGITKFDHIQLLFKYFFDTQCLFFVFVAICGTFIGGIPRVQNLINSIKDKKVGLIIYELLLLGLLFIAVMFMVNSKYSPFIYFQY